MHVRYWQFGLGLMSAFFVVGCGSGSGPPETLVPVAGTVMVNGKPLDGVVVTFIPEITKNNQGGSGTTSASGAFTVTDVTQNLPGLAPGKYTIAYSRMRLPDGSAPPEPKEGQPVNPGIIRVETLPAHLQSPDPRVPGSLVDVPKEGTTSLQFTIRAK